MSPKPRTLKYADTLQAVEQRVVDALPEISTPSSAGPRPGT
jgi:hypothetical protein